MTSFDLSKYKTLYLTTAQDYIFKLEQAFTMLKSNLNNADALDEAHIAAHSLKSQSLVMSHKNLGTICLLMEHYLRDVKEQKKMLTPQVVEKLLQTTFLIQESLKTIEHENYELDLTETINDLDTFLNNE